MDAVKFIKESKRMCFHHKCINCPAWGGPCISDWTNLANDGALEKYIAIVEKWSKEHPVITNEDKFKQVFGDDWCKKFDGVIENSRPGVSNFLSDFLKTEYKEPTKKEINNGIHEN